MTPVRPDESRPFVDVLALARNRLEVGLASRTVAFGGIAR
jgi:hypothetical protein